MRFILCFLIISCLWSVEQFQLKDGTIIKGDRLSETETTIEVQTSFGIITINKGDLLLKVFKITLNSGEIFIGEKVFEDDSVLKLQTQNLGEIELEKSNILTIIESEATTDSQPPNIVNQPYQYRYSNPIAELLFGNSLKSNKNQNFSLGEEQLTDLFFDPTAYTLKQGTLYLSGLSFGFGVTDRFQVTTKWSGFFWGDMNFRPKLQLFEKGNWQKQQSLSIGAHYHSRWWPSNKHTWKSGKIENVKIYIGQWGYEIDGTCEENDGNPDWCYEKTAASYDTTLYWGGWFEIGEGDPTISYEENQYDDSQLVNSFHSDEPQYDIYNDDYYGFGDNLNQMIELFGAYTFSTARSGLKGRISHTIGGNLQYLPDSEEKLFYRGYYGIDIDINSRLKMISEIFYDPFFVEFYNRGIFEEECINCGEGNEELFEKFSLAPIEKSDSNPIHLDFGFIYAFNESFRFGIHFQQPWVAIYWKF